MSLETMTKLASTTVGVGGTASITFSNIPQGYTDICLKVSIRTNRTGAVDDVLQIQPNGLSSNLTTRNVRGNGSGAASGNNTTWSGGYVACNGATSNTFGNLEVYFSNYSGFNYKSWSVDAVNENNATEAYAELKSVLWSQSNPISSLTLVPLYGTSFNQHSTATLYGIKNARQTAGNSIKATGGNIVFDGTYVYHVFNSSGAFVPTQPITADILQVAGGGGGGSRAGGGGGAGGLLGFTLQSLLPTSYAVTVGAGGAGGGGTTTGGIGSSGGNSQFGGLTASVGGGWGIRWLSGVALGSAGSGGSGGGATMIANGTTSSAGSGTAGQGFAGGGQSDNAAGGGGAGGAGNAGNASTSGNGGVGVSTYSSWGTATGVGQNVGGTYYIAGGGGGGSASNTLGPGLGGLGGGGNGNNATVTNNPTGNGQPSTGGGGGGAGNNGDNASVYGGNGGSGVVIIRYKG